jgi:hypothetical protein
MKIRLLSVIYEVCQKISAWILQNAHFRPIFCLLKPAYLIKSGYNEELATNSDPNLEVNKSILQTDTRVFSSTCLPEQFRYHGGET